MVNCVACQALLFSGLPRFSHLNKPLLLRSNIKMKNVVTDLTKKTISLALASVLIAPMSALYAQPPAPGSPVGVPEAPAPSSTSAPVPATLTPAVAEVIRLAESGVGEDVVM